MTVFRSYALHNRKRKKKKRGGRSCFEEAQDSYGLEANHRRRPQRDNSYAPREKETDNHKVQKDLQEREEMAGFL